MVWSLVAFGQTSIQVQAPNIVSTDEQFNITFIIEGEDQPSSFTWNAGDDFQVVWGPQKGSSTSLSIINGKRTKSSQVTYTYVLRPKKTGKFQVAEASATVKGRTITSEAATIEVLSGGTSSSGQSNSGGNNASANNSQSAASGDVSGSDLYLRFTLSKTNVVIGEPITAELKIYQRTNIAGFEDAKFPTFNGFWSQETASPSNIEFHRENVDGNIYNAAVLRRYVLIPQQAGELRIDPAELVCLVNVKTASRTGNSLFDSFFDDGYTTIRKRISTQPVVVHSHALPSGAPASFGGGVGNFKISAKLTKDGLKTHEATSLLVTVSGRGNVSLLESPKINFPPDLEVYDVKTTENTSKSDGGTNGSKTFEYPFIPRSHGDFEIGPIEYSYYDINTGKYQTISAGTIQFNVEKGNAVESGNTQAPALTVDRKGVKNLAEDIRYIDGKPEYVFGNQFFVGSAAYWTAALLIALFTAAAFLILRQTAARRSDVVGMKTRRATKMAMGRLRQAKGYLDKSLYTAFYEELHKALLGFISDKLSMKLEDLNKDNISEKLLENGVNNELKDKLIALLDACEYARYSPDAGHEAMSSHYDDALNTISSIDSVMRNKKNKPAVTAMVVALLALMSPVMQAEDTSYQDSLWKKAVCAYTGGQWQESLDAFKGIAATGVTSPVLYYNIGNAEYKSGNFSAAILNYERALKADPSFTDARYNLDLVNNLIQDKIDVVPEFILKTWCRKLCYLTDSDAWAVVSLIFLAAFGAMLVLFLMRRSPATRRVGFYVGILSLLLSLGCLGMAFWQKNSFLRADYAIIMKPVSAVKSSPSAESSKDLFVLHEGTKIQILDSVGEWNNISLSDGRQGWIKASDMEVI